MRGRGLNKSIAIIGEGETEWFYFDSLRIYHRYPFRIAPGLPSHPDIDHIMSLAERYVKEGYDYVICLIDMDRISNVPAEWKKYQAYKSKRIFSQKVTFIETFPCLEFWFLLHFSKFSTKVYNSYEELLPDLQRYLPNYEKSKKYFKKVDLYRYLKENGDMDLAIANAKRLCALRDENPEDRASYCEIYKIFKIFNNVLNTDPNVE